MSDAPNEAAAPPSEAGSVAANGRRRRLRHRTFAIAKSDVAAAFVTWIVGLPLAVLVVHLADLDPFSTGGVVMPLAVGCVVAGGLLVLWLRTRHESVLGICAGAYGAWVSLTIAASLHGTPFGIAGLFGDAGRLVSMMTRFTTTWRPMDGTVHNLPTEYPPLYPWLVGHVANIVHRPAWELVADAQIIAMGLVVVVTYAMWRLLVGPRTALVIVALVPAGFASPNLVYEVFGLLVLLPWAVATFGAGRYGAARLHWLPAGIIGGLIVVTYPGFLYFSMLGLVVIVVITLRGVVPRRAYLLHLLGVIAVAFVVASWYVVPYFYAALTDGGSRVSDMYLPGNIADQPLVFPFLEATPLGLVQLIGLFGLFWYRRSWWGLPLLSIGASVVVYRVFYLIRTAHDGHTGYLAHTGREITGVLVVAGVLTVATAVPELMTRLRLPSVRLQAVTGVAVAVLVAWSAVQGWQEWMPGPRGVRDATVTSGGRNLATLAHTEWLPGGGRTKFAPPGPMDDYFPARDVADVIKSDWHGDRHPVVLSYSQKLYAFYPFYGYETVNRNSSNSLQHWDLRHHALEQLSTVNDPNAFADESAHTAYGSVDVFVLREHAGAWMASGVPFSPSSFRGHFTVAHLANNTIVAVRTV